MLNTPAIEICGLTKDFRVPGARERLRAVDALNLVVERNEVFGLLGPNGSGKSTTIKSLLGLLKPTQGACRIFGRSCDAAVSRKSVGYLPEAPYFQRFLTGRELLNFFGKLHGLSVSALSARVDALLEKVGLDDAGDRRIGSYSKGMLQRIGLAQAMIGDPGLLILDEPTAGVDPIGAADIAALIIDLKREGKTILLCSHLLSQVEAICDRVAIMGRGRLLREGTIKELTVDTRTESMRLEGLTPTARERVERVAMEEGATIAAPPRTLEALFLELVRDRAEKEREP